MEYVIRESKEKGKQVTTEVWLEKRPSGEIVFCVGRFTILALRPDGALHLHDGIPKHNMEGIHINQSAGCGQIKIEQFKLKLAAKSLKGKGEMI